MEFNVADLFESLVDVIPDREALVAGDRRLTYAKLDARANRIAHYLASRGIGPGDHVGMYLFNGAEYLEGMLAAFKIRAVPININYRYVADELEYLVRDADLKVLIHQRELTPQVDAVLRKMDRSMVLLAVDDDSGANLSTTGSVDFEEAAASQSSDRGFPPRSGDDLFIIYTGGTTGMPKGVMWRHEDVFFAGLQGGNPGGPPIERAEQLAENAAANPMALTFFPAAPFIHGAAQWAALIGMFGGGKVAVLVGRSFDPIEAARLIAREKVQTLTLVGDAMARPLIEAVESIQGTAEDLDISSLFVIGSAGAVLSEAVKEKFRALLPAVMIVDSFGATETGHQGSMVGGTGHGAGEGPLFMMNETNCVLDENRTRVEPGSGVMGKLARCGRIPVGYYNDPKKTAETFFEIDGVRWVMPGDIATVEADGMIRVFGRGSVCINSGGEKIFPEEVEAALKAHEDVMDAVVVGVRDERWGQRVVALVRLRDGRSASSDAIRDHCRAHVAGYKVPREVHFVDEVARQPSGKPDYRWAARHAEAAAQNT